MGSGEHLHLFSVVEHRPPNSPPLKIRPILPNFRRRESLEIERVRPIFRRRQVASGCFSAKLPKLAGLRDEPCAFNPLHFRVSGVISAH